MNEYDETLDYPLSFHVEELFGKTDLDDHDVNYLTRTEMQYARTALALESGLATMGMLLSHCECEHLENSEMRHLGHFNVGRGCVDQASVRRGWRTLGNR